MTQSATANLLLPALVVALGISGAGYFVSQTLYNSRVAINTADVKGLAERRVEADRAYWQVQYRVTGSNRNAMAELYRRSQQDRERVIALLKESGFDEGEVTPGVVDFDRLEFRNNSQELVEEKFVLTGTIEVETDNVHQVSSARARLNELIAVGVDIQNNQPAYHFTKLNEIKPAMLKEATTNARLAANEFAANAGVQVGGIRDARQGGFIIRDVGESYSDTVKIEKDVRVVTTITFYLTD